jgi:hypothetical protein
MIKYQPYTSTPGDGGKAIVEGPTTGPSFVFWNMGNQIILEDFEFRHNGATSFAVGLAVLGNSIIRRVVVHDVRGSGFELLGPGDVMIEDEAYNCNQDNNAGEGGFKSTTGNPELFLRCIAHDNNNFGFKLIQGNYTMFCVSESNTGNGFQQAIGAIVPSVLLHNEAYNNGGDGLLGVTAASSGGAWLIENCNFVKNAGWGIDAMDNPTYRPMSGFFDNLGFGSGTMANGSGTTTNLSKIVVNEGPGAANVTYTANTTPWVNPANGDFRINNTQSLGTGYGYFYETAPSYTGTLGFPDLGAAQANNGVAPPPIAAETSAAVAQ